MAGEGTWQGRPQSSLGTGSRQQQRPCFASPPPTPATTTRQHPHLSGCILNPGAAQSKIASREQASYLPTAAPGIWLPSAHCGASSQNAESACAEPLPGFQGLAAEVFLRLPQAPCALAQAPALGGWLCAPQSLPALTVRALTPVDPVFRQTIRCNFRP